MIIILEFCSIEVNYIIMISFFFCFQLKVVFRNQRCIDCGATDDVRLMPAHCHMEKIFVHPGSIVQFHPKKSERYHDSSTILREHPGTGLCAHRSIILIGLNVFVFLEILDRVRMMFSLMCPPLTDYITLLLTTLYCFTSL